jgi:phosphate transport system permease protein
VIIPLFLPASISSESAFAIPSGTRVAADVPYEPLHLGIDGEQSMAYAVFPDGQLVTFLLSDGEPIATKQLFDGQRITAASFSLDQKRVVFGFADGSVRRGEIQFKSTFLQPEQVPEELRRLKPGEVRQWNEGLLRSMPEQQYRLDSLAVTIDDAVIPTGSSPVTLIDESSKSSGAVLATFAGDQLTLTSLQQRKNLITGKIAFKRQTHALPYEQRKDGVQPLRLLLSGLGDSLILIYPDGELLRYDVRSPDKAVVAERVQLTPGGETTVTAAAFLVGKTSLVVGDSQGGIKVWFPTKPKDATAPDGIRLVNAHSWPARGVAVRSLSPSPRTRMVVVGDDQGEIRLLHVTTNQTMATTTTEGREAILKVQIAPKDDGILALAAGTISRYALDPKHPEITLASLFMPVWYEGYEAPAYVWQSSGGGDEFEPKLSLVPLIFGTIKATVYSMLFAVPIALLAAIHTAEFLSPRAKSRIKPTIELMASLPSVVLGFLAALVFAPLVEDAIPIVILSFFTIPFMLLLGAYLWQFLPGGWGNRLTRLRLLAVLLTLPLGLGLAWILAPLLNQLLFAGDLRLWLDGQRGGAAGGWFILFLPVSAATVLIFGTSQMNAWLRYVAREWSPVKSASIDLVRFVVGSGLSILLAGGLAFAFSAAGFDPRGTVVDTYVQRNALVVGFVMGFAVIPIIYTIAEDALATVPQHLRSASLGAGATVWQTTTRIVIPTATSGLFSAVMVGLGRAVGETMIVLMAAGNTPIMDWNIFNGFRTLSANIAVELAEAVRDSTHYRTLFLASLSLFVLTFLLNTVAEVIRLRFRRRAFEL